MNNTPPELFEMSARGHCRAAAEAGKIKPKALDEHIENNWRSYLHDMYLRHEEFKAFQVSDTMKKAGERTLLGLYNFLAENALMKQNLELYQKLQVFKVAKMQDDYSVRYAALQRMKR